MKNGTQIVRASSFNGPTVTNDRIKIAQLTLTATITGQDIVLNLTEIYGGRSRSWQWNYRSEDGEAFFLPDDLHTSTQHMLVGVGQRLYQLQQNGFEREP